MTDSKTQIVLVNPNTSEVTTADMVEIARTYAPPEVKIEGLTAPFGAKLITTEAELDEAARAVLALEPELRRRSCPVIVAAIGDPAADILAGRLDQPVIGIAEASMRAAADGGRRFAVVTTTEGLVQRISARADSLDLGASCVGVLATEADPAKLMSTPLELQHALLGLAIRAVTDLRAEAIVIGGGPLARVAVSLSQQLRVPVIAPIAEAVRHIVRHPERPAQPTS